jgi:hypothetical protein
VSSKEILLGIISIEVGCQDLNHVQVTILSRSGCFSILSNSIVGHDSVSLIRLNSKHYRVGLTWAILPHCAHTEMLKTQSWQLG